MNYKLSNDIEKNPGPFMFNIDPSKTIEAPYSQGDAIDGRRDGKKKSLHWKAMAQNVIPKNILIENIIPKKACQK